MNQEIIDYLESRVDYQQVIGTPYQVEEMTLIPIVDILLGCGGGQEASGGGASLTPRAIIIIKASGEVSFVSLKEDCSKQEVKEQLPEILSRIEEIN
ncbi:spore germination protein GerW family protein [Halanaerobaculum tunisiense]